MFALAPKSSKAFLLFDGCGRLLTAMDGNAAPTAIGGNGGVAARTARDRGWPPAQGGPGT